MALEQEKWVPAFDEVEETALFQFMKQVDNKYDLSCLDYQCLWGWSVDKKDNFWSECWDFCDVIGEKGRSILDNGNEIEKAKFFPEAQLNYAENLLRRRDDMPALIFKGEDKVERQISFKELYESVSSIAQVLKDIGVEAGDRVAGYMPNMPETIIAMLATSSIGAIWSSASPDFGVQGVLDRFGQIAPKVLFTVDGYYYNGKEIDCLAKLEEITQQLPSLKKTIVVPYLNDRSNISELPNAGHYIDLIGSYTAKEIKFEQFPFGHPLFIMFSSGTTGAPKCIVHGAGGTLIQHLKEHKLQCDIREGDKVFYFTTCGWMMWNWLVTGLASGATLLLYDGSPFYPDGNTLWNFADKYKCTLFGTSAKYLDALKKGEYQPRYTHQLDDLRMITSTGSPLVEEGFDYVYKSIKEDVHLASISGGTDIISCFVLGNPISPVYRGEIQCAGLGMDVDIFDTQGQSLNKGHGELVCKSAFPSMPVGFWNDQDGLKYHQAYFDRFKNVWCHGDWTEKTEHGGFIIHGRSDATLNPGGVRIGTAEIYRQVEKLPEVKESIAVGQDWDEDVRVVLFVVMIEGKELTEDLIVKIKKTVREGATPRHVPAKVIAVKDIPRTKSGKITEIAVRDIIHGRPIKNIEALANPEALKQYEGIKELTLDL